MNLREAILIRNSASAKEYGMYSENMIIEDFLMKNGFGKSGGWWIFPGLGDCVCLRRPLRVKYIGSDHRLIAGSEYEIEDVDGDSYTVVGIDDRGGAFPISDFKIAEQSIDYGK